MCCGYPKVSRVYLSIYAMDVVLPCGGRSSVNTSKNAIDLLVRSALYNFRGEKISLVWGGQIFLSTRKARSLDPRSESWRGAAVRVAAGGSE